MMRYYLLFLLPPWLDGRTDLEGCILCSLGHVQILCRAIISFNPERRHIGPT